MLASVRYMLHTHRLQFRHQKVISLFATLQKAAAQACSLDAVIAQHQITHLVRVTDCFIEGSSWCICKLLCRSAKVLAKPLVNVVDLHHARVSRSEREGRFRIGLVASR